MNRPPPPKAAKAPQRKRRPSPAAPGISEIARIVERFEEVRLPASSGFELGADEIVLAMTRRV